MNNIQEYSKREYIKRFKVNGCPICGDFRVKSSERTKGESKYTIYECGFCNHILKREFEK